jgi:hypothetical protein
MVFHKFFHHAFYSCNSLRLFVFQYHDRFPTLRHSGHRKCDATVTGLCSITMASMETSVPTGVIPKDGYSIISDAPAVVSNFGKSHRSTWFTFNHLMDSLLATIQIQSLLAGTSSTGILLKRVTWVLTPPRKNSCTNPFPWLPITIRVTLFSWIA